jgi:hypothetical protein
MALAADLAYQPAVLLVSSGPELDVDGKAGTLGSAAGELGRAVAVAPDDGLRDGAVATA